MPSGRYGEFRPNFRETNSKNKLTRGTQIVIARKSTLAPPNFRICFRVGQVTGQNNRAESAIISMKTKHEILVAQYRGRPCTK